MGGDLGFVMSTAPSSHCRRALCANTIPTTLAAERLCLDHFLDEAFVRTGEALERCREGRPIQPKGLEWLLADALAIVKNLEEGAGEPSPEQRDRMLELLLILSNLQEYAAHHSIRLDLPA